MPGEHLERPGLDQVDQGLDGPLARPAHRLGRTAAHDLGRGAGQPDEGDGLAEAVVEAVEEAFPGQVPPGREHPLGHHRLVEDGTTGRPDEGPVEIDEDGAAGIGHRLTLPSGVLGGQASAVDGPAPRWPHAAPAPSDRTPRPLTRQRDHQGGEAVPLL